MTRGSAVAIAIAASIGAGVIHLMLGPEHLDELGALGWGFYLAAALQLGWAVAAVGSLVIRDPHREVSARGLARAGLAINVAILAAWVASRTVGLPAGEMPWVPEAVGRADSVAALLEMAIIAAIGVRLRPSSVGSLGRVRFAAALAVLVIAAGTIAGLTPDPSHAAEHDARAGSRSEMTDVDGVLERHADEHLDGDPHTH